MNPSDHSRFEVPARDLQRPLREKVKTAEDAHALGVFQWLERLGQDVRFGTRMLRKSPGFTIVALLTLALGIGANTAVFSVIDAAFLRPLHFGKPSSLVMVWTNELANTALRFPASPPNFFDWEERNHCFSGMAAFTDRPENLTGDDQPEHVNLERVSPNFFSVLGVDPMLGRGFSKGEDQPGKSNVAVLSYGLWKSHFGGDQNVIGKTIQLSGRSATVVGVAGPDFDFYVREHSFGGEQPQLWAPLEVPAKWLHWSEFSSWHGLRVIARLNPGISLSQAQAQMDVLAANLAVRYPEYDKGLGVELVSLRDQVSGTFRTPLFILLGAVSFVLLIACVNLSSLLLSRASARRHEIAIRLALGASRSRVTSQLTVESLLLSIFGGVAGTAVAIWATKALIHAGSGSLGDLNAVTIDWRVLVFAAGVTLLAGLIAGFLPSFMAAHGEVASALPDGRGGSVSRQSLVARHGFVVVEISLALILLAGSGLLIESFFRLTEVNPGFRVAQLLTFQVKLSDSTYAQETARAAFFSQFLDEIKTIPGAISATADIGPPFSGIGLSTSVAVVGEPPQSSGEISGTLLRVIEPGYFDTLGIPLLQGRTFSGREFAQPLNIVIVNKTFADDYLRGKNALDQKIIIHTAAGTNKEDLPNEIIGVVGDVHQSSLTAAPEPVVYVPYPVLPYKVMTVVVRASTPPLSLVPAIRERLHRIDKDQPMAKISTMEQLVADSVARSRFTMLLLSAFAGLALVLACIGIYGVTAYSVAQRTREIGIRMVLGVTKRNVLGLILGEGLKLTLLGIIIGILVGLGLMRFLSSLLFGIKPTDALTFIGVSVLLAVVALLACYIPARRAIKVDPMVALRYD